jgi:hypothetical protein
MVDSSYMERLARHCAILIAYEDTSMVIDENRLMLALVFLRNHCDMVLAERGKYDKDGEVTP